MKKILSLLTVLALVLALGAFLPEGVLRAKALGSITGFGANYLGEDRLYWNEYDGAAYYKVEVTSRVLNKTYKVTEPEFVFEGLFTEKGIIYNCVVTAYDSSNNALAVSRSETVCTSAKLTNMKINDDLTMTWDEFTGDYEEIHVNINLNSSTGSVAGTTTGADLKPYLSDQPTGRYKIWVVAKVKYDNTLYSDYVYLDYESTALFVTSTKATITQPQEGMTPADTQVTSLVLNDGDINASEAVKRTVLSWEDESGSALGNTDKFECGKKYTATLRVALVGRIYLDFDTGYYKYVTSSVNGIDTAVAHTYGNQIYELCVEITVPKTVKNISIEVADPKKGEAVNDSAAVTGEGAAVIKYIKGPTKDILRTDLVTWYDGHKALDSSTVFEAGKTYSVRATLKADSGYVINANTKVTINGTEAKPLSDEYGESVVVYKADLVCPPDRIPGDVNGDGEVTVKDVTLLKQYLAKWNVTINKSNADVDGDREVTIKDLTILKQYLAKWKVELK